jgi:hypothetical protein
MQQMSFAQNCASALQAASLEDLLRAEKSPETSPEHRRVITLELDARGELERPF